MHVAGFPTDDDEVAIRKFNRERSFMFQVHKKVSRCIPRSLVSLLGVSDIRLSQKKNVTATDR